VPEEWAAFLLALRATGVRVLVTEMDVREGRSLAGTVEERDQLVAMRTRLFTETSLQAGVRGVVTWGLSDRHSWLNQPPWRRPDGVTTRGLPLDESLAQKPMWSALADAFSRA
jgi:endo-1,4-beta-xylanase